MVPLRTVMVSIGEFRVSTDPEEVLTTCVGSCLAVALSDPSAGVAGLLHAVLPGPPPAGTDGYPEGYHADPGVRLLLEDVVRCGGRRENLTASVAGGASLLTQSIGDFAVGVRNQRTVLSLLKEEGIPVRSSALGGREGRRVSLAVGTGEVDVRETRQARSGESPVPSVPGTRSLRDVAQRLSRLGPNPRAAGALLDALHRHEIDWAGVTAIVSRDLVLMVQILRLANSDAYGRPREIGSLESGVALLGAAQVRRICVLAATARNASRTLADLGHLEPVLSRHGLASALAARRLSEAMPERERQEAFSASLLHGVDAIVAAELAPSDTGRVDSRGGAELLSEWKFPEGIIDAMGGERVRQACAIAHWLGVPCPSAPGGSCPSEPPEGVILAIARDLCAAGLLTVSGLRDPEERSP